ncbi:hypothetical protein E2C01_079646 [Portunus trituberculatus]|uniref:Uncharacterized protein n=1 Tax=Portunus trituberculatus TaxID=210409 RepID=A0A5B7IXJ9_PORTR|nr:hypothetical protein [Portunus trituberculatus]
MSSATLTLTAFLLLLLSAAAAAAASSPSLLIHQTALPPYCPLYTPSSPNTQMPPYPPPPRIPPNANNSSHKVYVCVSILWSLLYG